MSKRVAVGYIRVSTEDQTKNYSLEFQQQHIKNYCDSNGIILSQIYDENFGSGTSIDNRPVFQSMISNLLNNNEIRYIVVLANHRFSRDHVDAVNTLKKLHENNQYLICIADNINTEIESQRMAYQFMSIISESHRHAIVFNTTEGMKQRASYGLYNGGRITGYKSVNKELQIQGEEAEIIKEIFTRAGTDNWGFKKIAQYLNRMGLKTINQTEWTVFAVKNILSNVTYIGKTKFKGVITNGKHTPIITDELWEIVQNNLAARSYMPVTKHAGTHFLAGILKCPECRGSMVHFSSSNKKYVYYQCSNNKNGKLCSSNLVKKDDVENYVLNYIKQFIATPNVLNVLALKSNIIQKFSTDSLDANLKNEIKQEKKLNQSIQKTFQLFYESEESDNSIYQSQIAKLTKELNKCTSNINDLKDSFKQEEKVIIPLDVARNFEILFSQLNSEEKKKLVLNFISEIHIHKASKPKDRTVKSIVTRFELDDFPSLIAL